MSFGLVHTFYFSGQLKPGGTVVEGTAGNTGKSTNTKNVFEQLTINCVNC